MTLSELRTKHPQFIYESFSIKQEEHTLCLQFHFILLPDIHFYPEIRIPVEKDVDINALQPLVFHLGLVEAISYWKCACPPVFIIRAGVVSHEQITWWHDLFIAGLGEFFYRNDIDFTQVDFLTITNEPLLTNWNHEFRRAYDGDLVLVGGGKDSAVTLEQLKHANPRVLLVNPTNAALEMVKISGIKEPIVVNRKLDAQLFALNAQGYLNGHTPFSAFLGFLGILVAELYGLKRVIVSNEQSANEGNVQFHGKEINHQYSKSAEFEQKFREYNKPLPYYFSYLRKYNEIEIAKMFAMMPQYFPIFKSCNVGSKNNVWCGNCPKCAFTYLVLYPFISYEHMMNIFGNDYFANPTIVQHIRALVGLEPVKPFECVGTRADSKVALSLVIKKPTAPKELSDLWKKF